LNSPKLGLNAPSTKGCPKPFKTWPIKCSPTFILCFLPVGTTTDLTEAPATGPNGANTAILSSKPTTSASTDKPLLSTIVHNSPS
jgi:hypothetical protein